MSKKKTKTAAELDKEISEGIVIPELPPKGYKRTEELAKRTDQLEQESEELADKDQVYAMDSSALKPDRDIQRAIYQDDLYLDLGPEWKVCYKDYVHHNGSQAWKARRNGWIPVTADMLPKEERFKCKEDGTVRIGDVMAFCMPLEKYREIERKRHEAMLMSQYGVEATAQDYADKYGQGVFKLHSNLTGENPYLEQAQQRAAYVKSRSAAQTALRHIGNQMKQGPINGLPIKP